MFKKEIPLDITPILESLKSLGSIERAAADQSYHKSKREHWGVPVPALSKLASTQCKGLSQSELVAMARALWRTNLFDPMVCAAKILSSTKLKPCNDLWNTLVDFLKVVDGWALEDQLAHVAWKCILNDESLLDELEKWTKLSNFWMRRAALIYTLPYAKAGRNPERMLTWASSYASDAEWFIQKAIGWWLRDLGKHNPERVCLFLKEHWGALKGVARKEATRKLKPDSLKLLAPLI